MVSHLLTEDLAIARRVGLAWRDLRRGASTSRLRDKLYGSLEITQVDMLEQLIVDGETRMSELANSLRIDASTATRAVGRLVEAGLVRRTTASGDARGVSVLATAKGRRTYDAIVLRRRHALVEMLSDFEPDERLQLAELMERLVSAIDHYVVEGCGRS